MIGLELASAGSGASATLVASAASAASAVPAASRYEPVSIRLVTGREAPAYLLLFFLQSLLSGGSAVSILTRTVHLRVLGGLSIHAIWEISQRG